MVPLTASLWEGVGGADADVAGYVEISLLGESHFHRTTNAIIRFGEKPERARIIVQIPVACGREQPEVATIGCRTCADCHAAGGDAIIGHH
jgi:hypothetical protein